MKKAKEPNKWNIKLIINRNHKKYPTRHCLIKFLNGIMITCNFVGTVSYGKRWYD